MAVNFVGTIDSRGYTPERRTLHWMRGKDYHGETTLDPTIPRDGTGVNLARWRGGRPDLVGAIAECWLGNEHQGGEGPAVLNKLFQIFGIMREPTRDEGQEFCFCNVPEKYYDGMSIPAAQKILGDPTWGADRLELMKKGGGNNPWFVGVAGEQQYMTYVRANEWYQNTLNPETGKSKPGEEPEVDLPPFRPGDVQPLPGEVPDEPKPEPDDTKARLVEIKDRAKKSRELLRDKGTQASGGGQYARELRELLKVIGMMLVLLVLPLLTGCAAFRALNPFDGVRAADAEFHGTKAGEPISLTATVAGTLNDRAALAATLLGALGHSDPLGVLLPVAVVGEAQPRYVLCVDAMAEKCRQIPINAEVSFAGRPIGPGLLWKPSRLTAANYND